MKRTLAILALIIGVALTGTFAFAMAQSNPAQHDQHAQHGQADKSAMKSHSMMSKGAMGGMMDDKHSMSCPMMSGDPKTAGQHMLMMLKDEKHRTAAVGVLKQNPELREELKRILEESER